MEVTKQSLKDWRVTDNGSYVAWIRKVTLGYEVNFFSIEPGYFFRSFKEAKEFATRQGETENATLQRGR